MLRFSVGIRGEAHAADAHGETRILKEAVMKEIGLIETKKLRAALWLMVIASIGVVFPACEAKKDPEIKQAEAAKQTEGMLRFDLRGKVVSARPADRKVVIDHEDIPGYMDAMTMPFTCLDAEVLRNLRPGDRVAGTLVFEVETNRSWVENLAVTER
jgi:Cu/Ag efflux protein CusF